MGEQGTRNAFPDGLCLGGRLGLCGSNYHRGHSTVRLVIKASSAGHERLVFGKANN